MPYLVALLVVGILQMSNDGLTLLKGRGARLPTYRRVCTSYQGHMQRGHTHTTLQIRLVCTGGRTAYWSPALLTSNSSYLFCCSSTFCSMTLIRRAFLFFSEARAFRKSRTSSSSRNTWSSSGRAGYGSRQGSLQQISSKHSHCEICPPFGVPGSVSSPLILDCNLPLLLLPLAVDTAIPDYGEYAQCHDNQHNMQLHG